jgi:predicted RNase H-like HicB family nuclease
VPPPQKRAFYGRPRLQENGTDPLRTPLLPTRDDRNVEQKQDRRSGLHSFKIVVEKNEDGFVSYPLGFSRCIVGQGDTADEAIADVQSAIRFHIDSFGKDAFADDSPLLHAYVTEASLPRTE